MTYRIIFQLVLFLLPFLAYGIWRLATQEAIEEGRKPWPITILFATGAALAVLAWVVLIFVDRGGKETCIQRAYFEDGRVVLRPEIGAVLRAAYDPVMPPVARDPSHALRIAARAGLTGQA